MRKRDAVGSKGPTYTYTIPRTRVRRTAPSPVESPLQSGPGLAVPHSPPLLPAEGDEGAPESLNDTPASSHVLLGSGLRTASSVRDNHASFPSNPPPRIVCIPDGRRSEVVESADPADPASDGGSGADMGMQ